MAGEQELKLQAKLEGGEQTAKGLDKIAGAEKKLGEDTGKTAQAAEKATKAQEKLNAAEGDYIGILTQIHPALGQFADAALKGSKVAGDLASQQINLKGVLAKATTAIKANAGALKLLAAGGAVAAGIWAITKALEAEAKAHERVTAAVKAQREALNTLKQEQGAQKQAIEDVSDKRREGGFDAETSRAAAQSGQRIGAKFENIGKENIAQAVGLFGDKDVDFEQLINAAILAKLGKLDVSGDMPEEFRTQRLAGLMERHRGEIEKFRARESAQGQGLGNARQGRTGPTEREQAAFVESRGAGSTGALEAVLRSLLPAGSDVEKLAGLGQKYGGAAGLGEAEQGIASAAPLSVLMSRLLGNVRLETPEGGSETIGREEFVALINALGSLEKRVQESQEATGRAAEGIKEAVQAGMGKTVISMPHARNVYPDAAAVKRNTVNGESDRERRRVG